MDSTSSGENSNETVTAAALQMPLDMKKIKQSIRKHDRRYATDKYWSGLFVVVLIIWVVSWKYVIHHQADADVVTENITVTNKIPEFVPRKIDYYISENTSVVKNISKLSHPYTRMKESEFKELLHFLLYSLTCNLSHMGARNKEPSNVEYWDALGSIYCFIGSLFLLRFNKILRRYPSIVGVIFSYVAILEHLSITFHSNDSFVNLSLPFHEKLACWMMPESLFLIIYLSKMFSGVHYKNSKNLCVKKVSRSVVDSSDTSSVGDTNTIKDNFDFKKVRFYHCIHVIVLSFPLIVTLKLLMNSAISAVYKMGWGNVHSYVIVGGSYYLGYTVYYFGLMVISCTFSIASIDRSQSIYKSFLHALLTVVRYHFGTACFQATPIIPRLHAISVMREPRLNQLIHRKLLIERFFITNWRIYKLMIILTSVDGTNQSHSVKNLLRLYYERLLTKKSLQDFRSVSKCLLLFLLSTNSLAIVSLAAFGKLDDRFSLATWVMYLKIIYIFNMAIGFVTSVSDTFEILKMQSKLGDFSDEVLRVGVFSRYFLKDQPSDDAENV